MKNNLPKKTASAAVPAGAPAKKATKKTAVAGASQAAKKAAPAEPAAKTKPVATAKPTPAAKPTAARPAARAKKGSIPNGKAAKPALVTTFVAQVEVGWGNSLYLRGEGAPELSWERGILMKWEEGCWVYSTTGAKVPVAFKFLINDHIWAEGHNQHAEPGSTSISTPHFHY